MRRSTDVARHPAPRSGCRSSPERHPQSRRAPVSACLALLGAFELRQDEREVVLSRPAQRVLAFLALRAHPVLRQYVAETLWLDATQDRAAGSLRSALWNLRQPRCELVLSATGRLAVAPQLVVDVHEAVAHAQRLLDPTTDSGELQVAGLAHCGEILPDWCDDWVTLERERFRQLRLHALEAQCLRLTSAGRFAEAMEAGLAAVKGEPLRESAHRAVIGVHLAEGNVAEALDHYRAFRDRLRHDLDLAPSARLHELVADLTPADA